MSRRKIFNIKKLPMDVARLSFFAFRLFRREKVYKMPEYEKVKCTALIVANHTGFSDPLSVGAAFLSRRVHFMAAKEVMKGGLRKFALSAGGCVPVDRNAFDLECMKKCLSILKGGYMLAMFPQGGIVKDEKIDEIKSGAAFLACKGSAPVIPMYINKTEKFYQKKRIVLGKPVYPETVTGGKRPTNADIEELTSVIRREMVKCEEYYNEKVVKK